MKFRDYYEKVDEGRTPEQLKAMALMDKIRKKIAKGARYNEVSVDIDKAIRLLKEEIVMEAKKMSLLSEERADYSTQHLQDAIRHIRNGIEDIYELFDDIEDKKGMIQANKMKKEWKALEKMAKPFVYNMDKIHQFRDELKNGGPITKEEPAEKPVEKAIEERLRGFK